MPAEYYARQNKYGGWEVVDHDGRKAPKPNGFNQGQPARDRVAELNRAEGAEASRAPREIQAREDND